MKRPSFETIFMTLAKHLAKRSTCHRLKVGCVITTTDHKKAISFGYNGSAAGLPNGCISKKPGCCSCIHSEINAVTYCFEPTYVAKNVYVTHLPCRMCAQVLINLGGVRIVYYGTDYRDKSGKECLEKVGIEVIQL